MPFWLCGVLQQESMATLDVLEQRPDLLPLTLLITEPLVQVGVATAVAGSTKTAYAGGVAAGIAKEKARAAAAHD